jgi:protein-glucosylgalactosylhydroxylysine glucosidase
VSPFSPDPVTELADDCLPAYVSNGVVAVRVPALPWFGGFAVVNGLAGVHSVAAVECSPAVPYPLAGDMNVNGVWLSDAREQAEAIEQTYDFENGELTSRFAFHVDGTTATVTVVTFASRPQPTILLQETTVQLSTAAEVELRAVVAQDALAGRISNREQGVPGGGGDPIDGAMRWWPHGDLSYVGIAYASEFSGTSDVERSFADERVGALHTAYRFRARAQRKYRIRQYASLVPQAVHHDSDRQATRLVAFAVRTGFERLRKENREAWKDLWKGRVILLNAEPKWQKLADAAFFYLQSSAHPSTFTSMHIFGLAQWKNYHYYYGHVMWDIESFAVPPLLLTQPDAARALLQFRTRTRDAARYNARQWGYLGAQFPWQAGPTHGEESAPEVGEAAAYEHHVSMGVAHAFAQFVHATDDERFLIEQAWPVQADVADWIVSRAVRTERGYEIHEAMGIAERQEPADNVAYVNMSAIVALSDAITAAERLGRQVPVAWRRVRDGLVVPMNGDVILDHDGYTPREEKGSTPAALCALFPLGYEAAPAVVDATIRYYLKMAGDYVGSPMLSALYGAWAARIGDRDLSARLFEEGYSRFVSDRFLNTHEYRKDKFPDEPTAGPFTANLGAFLTSLLYGLPRLELTAQSPTEWTNGPIVMPASWDGIEVDRLWIRGRPAHLVAKHDDPRATLEFTD